LDTTIQLRTLRDDLINLRFNMEEMEITLEQSQFEPPATIRQAQINLDRSHRAYEQAMYNYELKVEQAEADMTEVTIDLGRQQRKKTDMEGVLDKFVIHAPASGMLIYEREWSGQKRTVGSEISTWDLTVATLPDLSTMLSKTYVNEIDISKLKVGQEVRIGVDAFPDKGFTGLVTEVANIGEQLPNTDAKVFEIIIKLDGTDPILRPSMTTSNAIIIDTFINALCIPLEAVHSNDSMTYVYKRNNTRQVVVLDVANENEIIVEAGLKEGDKVLLSVPADPEKMRFVGLELIEVIRQKELEKQRLEEEEKEKLRLQNEKMKQRPGGRPGAGSGGAVRVVRRSS
ncbi:MAG: HlyD family secretion protein, partial [Deltaproteobacteria bacterium]|nr:HlyD family secretion protein [Deltaproteobacteria bacterium]